MASHGSSTTSGDSIGTVAIKTGNRTEYLPFFEGCNSIGKNPNKNIIPIDDSTISEIHCIMRVCKHGSFVMDFGSFNGTYIGTYQNRVRPHHEVQIDLETDALLVAQSKCVFMLEPQWIADQKREVTQQIETRNKKHTKNKESKPDKEPKSQQKYPVRQEHRRSNDKNQSPNQKYSKDKLGSVSEESSQIKIPNSRRDDQTRRSRGLRQYEPDQRKNSKESENNGSQSRNNIIDRNKRGLLLQKQSDNSDSSRSTKNKDKRRAQFKETEKRSQSSEDNVESQQVSSASKHSTVGNQTSFKYNRHRREGFEPSSLSGIESPYFQLNGNSRVRILFSACSYPQNSGLAIKVVCEKDPFDVLIMSSYTRTYKLMMAVLKGKPIVNISWLHDSKKIGKLYNINDYLLEIPSPSGKGNHNNSNILRQSVHKVQNGFKIFEDIDFCLMRLFQSLIRLGGGYCVQRRRTQNVIGILSKADISQKNTLNKRFPDKKQIYSEELIYDACIYQELSFQRHSVNDTSFPVKPGFNELLQPNCGCGHHPI